MPTLLRGKNGKSPVSAELPDSLKRPFAVLSTMKRLLSSEQGAEFDKSFLTAAIKSFEDYQVRASIDPGPGYYRPINPERNEGINKFYGRTAMAMYNGFRKRMAGYAEKGDLQQKRMAILFGKAQN